MHAVHVSNSHAELRNTCIHLHLEIPRRLPTDEVYRGKGSESDGKV